MAGAYARVHVGEPSSWGSSMAAEYGPGPSALPDVVGLLEHGWFGPGLHSINSTASRHARLRDRAYDSASSWNLDSHKPPPPVREDRARKAGSRGDDTAGARRRLLANAAADGSGGSGSGSSSGQRLRVVKVDPVTSSTESSFDSPVVLALRGARQATADRILRERQSQSQPQDVVADHRVRNGQPVSQRLSQAGAGAAAAPRADQRIDSPSDGLARAHSGGELPEAASAQPCAHVGSASAERAGAVGTWAQRITRFDSGAKRPENLSPNSPLAAPVPQPQQAPLGKPPLPPPLPPPAAPSAADVAAKAVGPAAMPGTPPMPISPKRGRPAAVAAPPAEGEGERTRTTEEEAVEAAWRWRFGRRWQQEQARQFDPNYVNEPGPSDDWDEALGYLEACEEGWHMQIARTTSLERRSSLGASLVSQGSGLGTLLLAGSESQTEEVLRGAAEAAEATRRVRSVAQKAADLSARQRAIEQQVAQKWDSCSHAGQEWVGQYMPAVKIESFGRFTYALARMVVRGGPVKLLVRGKAHASAERIIHEVNREMLAVTAAKRLPAAAVELLGSGTMEWSRDGDRRLDVTADTIIANSDAAIRTPADVAKLASALTRASLPLHIHVLVNGEKLS